MRTNYLLFLAFAITLCCSYQNSIAQCTGTIFTSGAKYLGNPAVLNPNGDAKIYSENLFRCKDDYLKFAPIVKATGCASCQRDWTMIAGSEKGNDLWGGGNNCGASDIVSDTIGANTAMGYYSIVDFDGICNNGDEIIAFRMRIAAETSSGFGFSMLVDTDGLLGTADPEGIACGRKVANPGFEREIQLASSGTNVGVNVWNINGTVGVKSLVQNYTLATHAQQARACGSDCVCRLNGGLPAYISFFVKLSDLGLNCNTYGNIHIVPATNNSPTPIIAGDNSPSDIGGIGRNLADCPACVILRQECSEDAWEVGCAFLCAAANSGVLHSGSFPINFIDFSAELVQSNVTLSWTVSNAINQAYFQIERSDDNTSFEVLGNIKGLGNEMEEKGFQFTDYEPLNNSLYRIKSVDNDGQFIYSPTISVTEIPAAEMVVFTSADHETLFVREYAPTQSLYSLEIYSFEGQKVYTELFDCDAGMNEHSFHLPQLPKGIYLVQVSDINRVQIQRIHL